jgi:hypothetical protein
MTPRKVNDLLETDDRHLALVSVVVPKICIQRLFPTREQCTTSRRKSQALSEI